MIRPPADRVPDADLLGRFVRHRDEAAFELLVGRYQRLVDGVCRRTAGDRHAAEDAAQAAFLLLARRADRLRAGAALPGWLARVAYRCAVKARAGRRRERPAHAVPCPAASDAEPPDLELLAALDAELDRLPDRLRLPVVLVHLDGRTYTDAAAALGVPVGTLSGRLRRARGLLRDRLTRRGLAPLAVPALAADPAQVAAVTRAAVAFAAGLPPRDPPAILAHGVLRAMALPKLLTLSVAGLLAAAVVATGLATADPPPPPAAPAAAPAGSLDGTWLFDAAGDSQAKRSRDGLGAVWKCRAHVAGDRLTLELFFDSWKPVTGTIAVSGDHLDVSLPDIDLGFTGMPVKHAAGVLPGRYKRDGDTVTVCLAAWPGDPRPSGFGPDPAGNRRLHFTLKRLPATSRVPSRATVQVVGPTGQPVEGAEVVGFVGEGETPPSKRQAVTTGPDGTAVVKTADFVYNLLNARKPASGLIGVDRLTPARLAVGPVRVVLGPAVKLTAPVECPELAAKPGGVGWLAAYLYKGDARVAFWSSAQSATAEFTAPPGDYTLHLYGSNLHGKDVPVTVPADRSEVAVPPTRLQPTRLALLVGEPAPPLPAALGWKNSPPLAPADLAGKVVVLDFWGWWCGPCVQMMPELFALYDQYKGRGVVFVGVHVDGGGAAPTVGKLDAKLSDIRKTVWKGRDVPFPVALYGDRDNPGGPSELFGITGYPATVVIDKKGRVTQGRRVNAALLDKLLAE